MVALTNSQRKSIQDLCKLYGIDRIRVFGSRATGVAGPTSDLDLIVRFSLPPSLYTLIRFQRELSDKLNLPCDVVTEDAIPEELKGQIESEAIAV